MKGLKTVYICSNCEYISPKWLGKCPKCNSWNSFVEDVEQVSPTQSAKSRPSMIFSGESHVQRFNELTTSEYVRSQTGLSEFDRVLGGGLVLGSEIGRAHV